MIEGKASVDETRLKVLLIGNYIHDRQESMQRFARMLALELPNHGISADFIQPEPWFGRLRPSPIGIGKWLGYFDKFVIFPFVLRRKISALQYGPGGKAKSRVVVHICDHSNAFYEAVTNAPTLVTCHDLLAVRGALGEDTDCPASWAGRILQKLILRGLSRADFVVCVSSATRRDLLRLMDASLDAKSGVVWQGKNHPYQRLSETETDLRLAQAFELNPALPFVLCVGLNLKRKNREGALRIISQIRDEWPGQIVFAGEPLDDAAFALARSLGVAERVVQIRKPSNDLLEALYNRATALLFPSKCEGFGWPIIEAQACGCPVICSDRTSVPEVAGEGAIVCQLEDEASFARAILEVMKNEAREELVAKGLRNLERFELETMVNRYVDYYAHLSGDMSKEVSQEAEKVAM